ncbi:GAF domain-containing protein [Acuticoccus sp.]|uniref:GAF domain-containing protein n=1 Tax=Acuticoccus sp. TaxID=1904378 RepID=UPI003B52D136
MSSERLMGIAAIKWLSSPEHATVSAITRHLLRCPTAMVNLADTDGPELPDASSSNLTFQPGLTLFSRWTVARGGVFVVLDAANDPRFADNVMVRAYPHTRFYVGTPVTVRGRTIGVLCAVDYAARQAPEPNALDALMSLASLCGEAIEHTATRLMGPVRGDQFDLVAERSDAAVLTVTEGGLVAFANRAANRLLRAPTDALLGAPVGHYIVGWERLLTMFEQAFAALAEGQDRVRSILVEAAAADGAIVPARASISHVAEMGEFVWRLVLSELPTGDSVSRLGPPGLERRARPHERGG